MNSAECPTSAERLSQIMRQIIEWIVVQTVDLPPSIPQGISAPERERAILAALEAFNPAPEDPVWIRQTVELMPRWIRAATEVCGRTYRAEAIDALVDHAAKGDQIHPIGLVHLLGTSTVHILVMVEEFDEASQTAMRLLLSPPAEHPIFGRTLVESLARSLSNKNLLERLSRPSIERALAGARLSDVPFVRTQLVRLLRGTL